MTHWYEKNQFVFSLFTIDCKNISLHVEKQFQHRLEKSDQSDTNLKDALTGKNWTMALSYKSLQYFNLFYHQEIRSQDSS